MLDKPGQVALIMYLTFTFCSISSPGAAYVVFVSEIFKFFVQLAS